MIHHYPGTDRDNFYTLFSKSPDSTGEMQGICHQVDFHSPWLSRPPSSNIFLQVFFCIKGILISSPRLVLNDDVFPVNPHFFQPLGGQSGLTEPILPDSHPTTQD